MFAEHNDQGYHLLAQGIERKTLVHGDKTLLAEFRLAKGAVLPRHTHPHEQTGYLVSGALRLHIGDEARDLCPGDAWSIPGNIEHGAEVLESCIAIEVFSPIREDYL